MEEKIVRLSNLYALYVLYSIEKGDARALGARNRVEISFRRPVTLSYVMHHDVCPMMVRDIITNAVGITIGRDRITIIDRYMVDRYMSTSTITIVELTGVCIYIDALRYLINLLEIYRAIRSRPDIVANREAIHVLEDEVGRALDILSTIALIAREIPDRQIIDMAEEVNKRSRASIVFSGSDRIDIDDSNIHVNRYFGKLSVEHVSSEGTRTIVEIEPRFDGTIDTRIHVDRRTAEKALDAAINKVMGIIRTLLATKIAIDMLS